MRRLLIAGLALALMACQSPPQATPRPVKPKAKPSAAASVRPSASRSPAASVAPSTTPSQASSTSPSPGGTSGSPAPSPVLDLVVGTQTADTWIAGPSLQRPRAGLAAGSVSGELMAVEGDHRASVEFLSTDTAAWVLDTRHDGPMNPTETVAVPLGVTLTTSAIRGENFYTAGGSIGLGPIESVLRYSKNGYLGVQGSLGAPVKATAGGIIGENFYAAGGMVADGTVTNAVQSVNVVNGDASTHPAMPKGVGGAASAVVGNKLYVLGGYTLSNGTISPQTTVQVFDPATTQWVSNDSAGTTKPAPMPVARHSAAAAVLGGKIYLVGGSGTGGGVVDVVSIYDPAANTWTAGASLPTPRSLLALAAHADRLWAIGGVDQDGRIVPTVEVYRP